MHNKLFIADNAVAIVGGRNLGDEYFEAHPRLDLRDLDLLTVGPVVPQLSASFDAYWNFEKTLPVAAIARHSSKEDRLHNLRRLFQNHKQRSDVTDYLQEVAAHPVSPWKMIWAKGTVLADFPCKLTPEQPHCASLNFDRFYGLFGKADSELMIISPYFIPGEDGIALFRHLRENKVRIRILTNSFAATDLKLVQAGYNRYRRSLLDEQVELYEFKPTFPLSHTRRKKRSAFGGPSQACMHAKAYVIDKKQVFVGSFNHDPRSAILNTEVGILIDSSELAAQLKTLFDRYTEPQNSYRLKLEPWKDGRKKLVWQTEEEGNMRTFHQEPLTSWWQHLKNALMAIFAPEDLL
jgi:putative cardiolipin synthase